MGIREYLDEHLPEELTYFEEGHELGKDVIIVARNKGLAKLIPFSFRGFLARVPREYLRRVSFDYRGAARPHSSIYQSKYADQIETLLRAYLGPKGWIERR